jgi:hypothetical protein
MICRILPNVFVFVLKLLIAYTVYLSLDSISDPLFKRIVLSTATEIKALLTIIQSYGYAIFAFCSSKFQH